MKPLRPWKIPSEGPIPQTAFCSANWPEADLIGSLATAPFCTELHSRTFEPAMLKAHRTRANARKHHARRAGRIARALDGCQRLAGEKTLVARHFPAFGGSAQHSRSSTDANGGTMMQAACASKYRGSVVNIAHFPRPSRAADKETASAQGWAQRPFHFESASGCEARRHQIILGLDGSDQF
jgi:hypothetical protein